MHGQLDLSLTCSGDSSGTESYSFLTEICLAGKLGHLISESRSIMVLDMKWKIEVKR